jgi:hypothetical protein
MVNNNEVCDGTNLGGKTCSHFGYNEGILSCCSDCNNLDFSSCKNATRTCTDHDIGPNQFYTASYVSFSQSTIYGPSCPGEPGPGPSGGGGSISDTCNTIDSNILFEGICFIDGTAGTMPYNCPNGCSNGACITVRSTFYVSPTGAGSHDGSSTANAMNLAEAQAEANSRPNDGLTFLLLDGSYGQAHFDRPRNSKAIWKANAGSNPILEQISIYRATNLEFDNLNIIGPGAHTDHSIGIHIMNGYHITVKNSRISEAITGISASGYKIDISNNMIYNVGSDQIYVFEPSNNIFILENEIFSTKPTPMVHADGIQLFGGYMGNVSEVFIRDNNLYNLSGQGIMSRGAIGLTIERNTLAVVEMTGMNIFKTRDLSIQENDMAQVTYYDIILRDSHNGVIANNNIELYGPYSGIWVDENTCTNIEVYGNTIT